MPVTQQFDPVFGTARTYVKTLMNTGPFVSFNPAMPRNSTTFIHALAQALSGAGWIGQASIQATGNAFYFPFGVGTVPNVTPIVGPPYCSCSFPNLTINGVQFTWYDPHSCAPNPTNPPYCVMVPYGLTMTATITNMASAIQSNTPYNASGSIASSGTGTISMTSKIGGPDGNFPFLTGKGNSVLVSTIFGGGYQWVSVPPNQITLKATGVSSPYVAGSNEGWVQLDFTINGGTVTYHITMLTFNGPTITYYHILAGSQYIMITDLSTDNFEFDSRSCFACSPLIPAGWTNDFESFIVGPAQIGTQTYWDGAGGFSNVSTAQNIPLQTWNNSEGWPRVLLPRQPGTIGLTTPDNKNVVYGSYAMFDTKGGTPTVVGQIPDSIITTEYVARGTTIGYKGHLYLTVGNQDGNNGLTRSSFLMRIS